MKKISVDQAEDKKCKEISTQDEIMSFLGWKDSYKNQKSKIILKNSKTGEIWDTTSYNNFTNTTKVIKSSGKYYKKNIVGKSKLFEEKRS